MDTQQALWPTKTITFKLASTIVNIIKPWAKKEKPIREAGSESLSGELLDLGVEIIEVMDLTFILSLLGLIIAFIQRGNIEDNSEVHQIRSITSRGVGLGERLEVEADKEIAGELTSVASLDWTMWRSRANSIQRWYFWQLQ